MKEVYLGPTITEHCIRKISECKRKMQDLQDEIYRFVVEMSENIDELETKYSQLLDRITNLELESKKSWWQRFKDWFLTYNP